ncbi:MAG: autotransporter-associated beta strand repeat-containing protein, partial [Kiritimatiellae bacterium]|nr:autotransporter-associated beta strand repeat-containing protein [Kiritimatiellia bacterium]
MKTMKRNLDSQNKAVSAALSPHSKRHFQPLEVFFSFFPMIGKMCDCFSNHWKKGFPGKMLPLASVTPGSDIAAGNSLSRRRSGRGFPPWRGLPVRETSCGERTRAGSPSYGRSLKYRTDPFSFAFALFALFVVVVPTLVLGDVTMVEWRSEAANGNWENSAPDAWWYPWWNSGNGESQSTPDAWDSTNYVHFGNNNQKTMSLNDRWFNVQELYFDAGASEERTISDNGINLQGAKIENLSSANHTFNSAIGVNNWGQLNPVNGNLTFNGTVYVNSYWIDVYGDNGKFIHFFGVLDCGGGGAGTGGLTIKENSYAILTNNNTFTGNINIEKGGVRLGNDGGGHTNAAGLGTGEIKVGTNAVLELHASVPWRPRKLELYGTGVNSAYGAFQKHENSGSGTATWPGAVVLGQDANIGSASGTLYIAGALTESGGSHKLVKKGGATLQLAGTNTYTGGTYIDDGILAINHGNSIGTNSVDIGSASYTAVSAELQLAPTAGGISMTNTVNVKAKSGAASRTFASLNTSGENIVRGAVSINTDSQLRLYMPSGSGTLSLTNVISGDGSVWLDAAGGVVTFFGNNTYG